MLTVAYTNAVQTFSWHAHGSTREFPTLVAVPCSSKEKAAVQARVLYKHLRTDICDVSDVKNSVRHISATNLNVAATHIQKHI